MQHASSPMPATPPQPLHRPSPYQHDSFQPAPYHHGAHQQQMHPHQYEPRVMHQHAPQQAWQQSPHPSHARSPVPPAYILTSNNDSNHRPTSAPMKVDDQTSEMSTPASAMPLTPNGWTAYPGSDEQVNAANMWRNMVPTSHPSLNLPMEKPGYASSCPGSYDEHVHTHANYDMFSSPMVRIRDRQWEDNDHLMATQRPHTGHGGHAHHGPPSFYAPSAATMSPAWSHEPPDNMSMGPSDSSRCDSRSPMMHAAPAVYDKMSNGISPVDDMSSQPKKASRKRALNESDARCQCHTCGKFFQRAYNLRAHKETHNPNRLQPFHCDADGCDKRFVRRTDLSRHIKSVHVQVREHACTACHARFARKDTMRRHALDGCPARLKNKKRVNKLAYFDVVDTPMGASSLPAGPLVSWT